MTKELQQQQQQQSVDGASPATSTVTLAARIGAGKYSLGFNPPRYALIAELHITYSDGSTTTFATNGDWKMSNSPIAFENLYQGEIYDARLEQPGWNIAGTPSAFLSEWAPATVIAKPILGKLSAQLMPQIKVIREVTPTQVQKTKAGAWRFALGENIAGVPKMRLFKGVPAGTTITLTLGEIIDNSTDTVSNPFTNIDEYIYSGKELDGTYWTPTFVYHGCVACCCLSSASSFFFFSF